MRTWTTANDNFDSGPTDIEGSMPGTPLLWTRIAGSKRYRYAVAQQRRAIVGRLSHLVNGRRISVHRSSAPHPQPQGMRAPAGRPPRLTFEWLRFRVAGDRRGARIRSPLC